MPPQPHFNLDQIDFSNRVAEPEDIGKYNPQRFEMRQLDGIVHVDKDAQLIVGYKDVRDDEFWIRGHMPGYPLMPGVLMCEASAQMCSYYALKVAGIQGDFIGFGGMDNVRFRGTVHPGDRLIFIGKAIKITRRVMIFNVQGYVKDTMVYEGDVIGMVMNMPKRS